MIVVHIFAQAKDGQITTFERRLRAVVDEARQSQGCLKYEWYRVPDVADQFVIYAEFDQEENFHQYLASPIVKKIGEELIPLIEGGPKFKHFRATIMENG